MDPVLKEKLERVAPLGFGIVETPKCKICAGSTGLFDVVDFNKHCSFSDPLRFGISGIGVSYYRCSSCSLIFTDLVDDWEAADFARFIYNDDYIKVDPEYFGKRSVRAAKQMTLRLAGMEGYKILDYGSGSGEFAREMRKQGFRSVANYDPYSSPSMPGGPFDIVTCFEVMEHSPNPISTLREMAERLSSPGAIIIGQSLQPKNIEELGGRWWYIAPRNGHVSMFAEETMLTMASELQLDYHRGDSLYALTKGTLGGAVAKVVAGIGEQVQLLSLNAPPPESNATPMWNGVEAIKSRMFRWSAAERLVWENASLRAGSSMVQIPFLMEVRANFANQSVISVDGKKIATRVERHRIIGDVKVRRPRICKIELVTPPLCTPQELRGEIDTRKLGLAIRC